MPSDIFSLFPTLVVRKRNLLSQEQLATLYKFLLGNERNSHGALTGNGESSHDHVGDIITEITADVIQGFDEIIQSALDEYTTTAGISANSVTNSWYTVQHVGSQLKQHLHANSILSAVLYVNAPEGSNRLYFDHPNKFIPYTNQVTEINEFNYEYYYFDVEDGDIIIFPSWLAHGSAYDENKTNNRTILSLNARYQY
jgi:uncharacterized protein (TIGR02466 family)|tara:strand:+ start:329 stop:922 length:594 start_codon:yes stop_codon:yes gene_type:complete